MVKIYEGMYFSNCARKTVEIDTLLVNETVVLVMKWISIYVLFLSYAGFLLGN